MTLGCNLPPTSSKVRRTERASFDVALFFGLFSEREVSENGETRHSGRILEISPAEEGASPWSSSPIRYRVSRDGWVPWG
jgi:hypothetical protein